MEPASGSNLQDPPLSSSSCFLARVAVALSKSKGTNLIAVGVVFIAVVAAVNES